MRPITTAERTITQSRTENLKIVCPKNPKNNIQKTITSCPSSIPKANSNTDNNVLSFALTIDSKALANPNP